MTQATSQVHGKADDGGPAGGDEQRPVRFSTVGLPAAQRLERWEHYNAQTLIGLGCKTLSDAALEATELNLQLPDLQFAQVSGNPHVVERTQSYIDAHPADAVVVYFALEGEAFFYHRNGCEMLRPGQAILHDADQPFMRGFSRGLKELALKVPRPLYTQITGDRSVGAPRIFDFRGTGSVAACASTLARLIKSGLDAPVRDRGGLEETALDLFRALVTGGAAGGGKAHLAAAKAFIGARLRNPRLSAAAVADGIGLSDRQLSRVFAAEGTSVARYILDQRLDAARQMLATSGGTPSIGRTAAEFGFSSQAYFSRAFKERFGLSPAQLRQR